MWEAIQLNRRRSAALVTLMGATLVALGFLIGLAFDPFQGGAVGAIAALGIWLILWGVAVAGGEQVLLMSARARQLQKEDAPRLWNVVEEMSIAAGLGTMPRLYLVEQDAPNAFAVGTRPSSAAIAVTSGLLRRLNRDELQGVVAHEVSHIVNQDARFLTIASVMLGSIVLISDLFLRGLWFGGGKRRTVRGGGQAQLIFLGLALVAAVLAPLVAQLLYFACSRRREYLADASAARFTRYPDGLASALEKIGLAAGSMGEMNRAIAPLFIVNPLQSLDGTSLLSTHPPIQKRIRILRSMGGRAGYVDYENAFKAVEGGAAACLDRRTLGSEGSVAARPPTAEPKAGEAQDAVVRAQEVAALLGRLGDYVFIPCLCGVGIRVPPGSEMEAVACPRCGRNWPVPRALPGAAPAGAPATAGGAAPQGTGPPSTRRALRYQRRGGGWEAFRCACGRVLQISPSFATSVMTCRRCGRSIEIAPPPAAEPPSPAA